MPLLAFCPFTGFRQRGFFYTKSDFDRNSFTKEEIFDMPRTQFLLNKAS
jgi:hypothetical protein